MRRVLLTRSSFVPVFVLGVPAIERAGAATCQAGWLDAYREPAARLIGEAVSSTFAWHRLAVLTDTIGNRLSGTPALDRAIQWAVAEMKKRRARERAHRARHGAEVGARRAKAPRSSSRRAIRW